MRYSKEIRRFPAILTGLEPATFAVTGRRANHLRYRTILFIYFVVNTIILAYTRINCKSYSYCVCLVGLEPTFARDATPLEGGYVYQFRHRHVVPPVGLEPTTRGLRVRYSDQLSYGGSIFISSGPLMKACDKHWSA